MPTGVSKTAASAASTGGAETAAKPYLEITFAPITEHMATRYRPATSSGALVTAVAEESPAYKAGIRQDDIVVEADSQRLSNETTIIEVMNRHLAGDKVDLVVIRDGQQRTIEVVLASRP